jgi:hypothetical protein
MDAHGVLNGMPMDKDRKKTVQSSESMIYIAQIQILLNRHFKVSK